MTTTTDLITERLVLRLWSAEERTAVLAVTAASNGDGLPVRRPAHWADDFPDEGDQVIADGLGRYPAWMGPFGHRQVVERDSGLIIGGIGLFWPPTDGRVEIGYGIVPSRQGRGYATEAVIALTEFAFALPAVRTVLANVERPNPASIRVLAKSGFRHHHTEGDTVRFHRDRP
ncbi:MULTISPECIES: GNAT family N-acetyltransferase [unclassified Pseudofrankia]|uniref:GNAT family N-acetyltransferase n=1 Tax=unclassified Pseudofrankia TaxID=2994372 RepID=UPI0008D8F955|nr:MULTISPECIES: GNAT family N-acetyltransferase [unclassified Pseudofrankia]MDT3439774.1 GNAT family N-acetyltransferase [Pseudofrankia sp. BMG5.37]OHV44830.1 acetyltransferase [Pseudofrankia sp. BMG5.36]